VIPEIDPVKQRIEARALQARQAAAAAQLVAIRQLPLWSQDVRGLPNPVLRGALFTISREREIFKKRTIIASLSNMEIRFTGERWNQADLDVWENLVHIARLQPLGERLHFTAHSLLQLLGRDTGGHDHEALKNDIVRLMGGIVEINWLDKKKSYASGLISKCFRDEETGMYALELPRELYELYTEGTTRIDWAARKALGTHSLAKWLHCFYASHGEPYSYKVKTLHKLCGSSSDLRNFRRSLHIAFGKLKDIGFIHRFVITDDDTVIVHKSAKAAARADTKVFNKNIRRTNEGLNCAYFEATVHGDADIKTRRQTQNGRNTARGGRSYAWV
jgi:TrfA protein